MYVYLSNHIDHLILVLTNMTKFKYELTFY